MFEHPAMEPPSIVSIRPGNDSSFSWGVVIPPVPAIPVETTGVAHGLNSDERLTNMSDNSPLPTALDLAEEVKERYDIESLSGLIASARAMTRENEISVAVLGRFKAGKSSFLNHFLGRDFLPVGVVPVTSVVTKIRYGEHEEARVHYQDGRDPEIPLDGIGRYITEKTNPENVREVVLITVELPEVRRFRGLQFVDTPGLDSALAHNTQTALDWLPQVGLALVAVSVDPPLSQRDIELLQSLYQYTPKVAVLLTKADLLNEHELRKSSATCAASFRGTSAGRCRCSRIRPSPALSASARRSKLGSPAEVGRPWPPSAMPFSSARWTPSCANAATISRFLSSRLR
jgi:GTP-binding protein EngB required for normal cell division